MKKLLLLIIAIAILMIIGCTKDSTKSQPFQLEKFYNGFTQSNLLSSFSTDFKPYYSVVEYNNGKVSKVIHENSVYLPIGRRIIKRLDCNTKDTTYYFYSKNGNLEKSFTRTLYNNTITRNFFFDENNNLVHIKGLQITNKGFRSHIFEYFRKFDTGLNGFKNFGIIEGAFIRSLSKNNYNEYARAIYNDNNLITDSLRIRMPVTCDGEGHPIYNEIK